MAGSDAHDDLSQINTEKGNPFHPGIHVNVFVFLKIISMFCFVWDWPFEWSHPVWSDCHQDPLVWESCEKTHNHIKNIYSTFVFALPLSYFAPVKHDLYLIMLAAAFLSWVNSSGSCMTSSRKLMTFIFSSVLLSKSCQGHFTYSTMFTICKQCLPDTNIQVLNHCHTYSIVYEGETKHFAFLTPYISQLLCGCY